MCRVPFEPCSDVTILGGKGARLVLLSSLAFRVPDAFIVVRSAFLEHLVRPAVALARISGDPAALCAAILAEPSAAARDASDAQRCASSRSSVSAGIIASGKPNGDRQRSKSAVTFTSGW
jgi:hypothetical protein